MITNTTGSTGNGPYSNRPYSVGLAVMFWNTRHDRRGDRAARRIILPGRQAEDEGHHGDELPIAATASDVRAYPAWSGAAGKIEHAWLYDHLMPIFGDRTGRRMKAPAMASTSAASTLPMQAADGRSLSMTAPWCLSIASSSPTMNATICDRSVGAPIHPDGPLSVALPSAAG
jgi:hypothetical protein